MSWGWLENPARPARWAVMWRVALKALALFSLVNLAYAVLDPLDALGRVSIYNVLVPGRERLVNNADTNAKANYQSTVMNVPSLIASHKVAKPKSPDEFRVLLLGDSGIRSSELLIPYTIVAHYNRLNQRASDSRTITMYSLAHHGASVFKDFILLDESIKQNTQPDLVIWMTTLYAVVPQVQYAALLKKNSQHTQILIDRHNLNVQPEKFKETLQERVLYQQRRALADMLHLQTFGIAWAATRYDGGDNVTYILDEKREQFTDYPSDILSAANQPADFFAFDILDAGHILLGDIPLIIVNEPVHQVNSPEHPQMLNLFYPRDVYEHYQRVIQQYADENGWHYFDLWDAIPPEHFTNSPLHYDAEGARILAERLADIITQVLAEEAQ